MKRKIVFVVLACTVLALSGCGGGASSGTAGGAETKEAETASAADSFQEEETLSTESEVYMDKPIAVEKEEEAAAESEAELANPFVECKTIEAAGKAAGFSLSLPELPSGYEVTAYRAMHDEMIEVIAKNGDKEIRLRKAAGTEDASGDYNEYKTSEEVTVGEAAVTEKSNDDGVHCAVWTDGQNAYSITSDEGLTAETVASLVTGMMS